MTGQALLDCARRMVPPDVIGAAVTWVQCHRTLALGYDELVGPTPLLLAVLLKARKTASDADTHRAFDQAQELLAIPLQHDVSGREWLAACMRAAHEVLVPGEFRVEVN